MIQPQPSKPLTQMNFAELAEYEGECSNYYSDQARQRSMRAETRQDWSVGQTVKVGFVQGLEVVSVLMDGWLLSKGGQSYTFRAYEGLRKV
jgi:hypothetical protein